MFCKECGHKIPEDSKFCKECGKEIIEPSEENDNKKDRTAIIIFVVVALHILVIASIVAAVGFGENGRFEDIFSQKATIKDIELDFYEIPSLGGNTKYGVVLQANEKIENLVIEIDFLDKNKKVLKTETLNIGKVTPGNVYKYEISQSGMEIDDLDKTKSFHTRVIEGNIID